MIQAIRCIQNFKADDGVAFRSVQAGLMAKVYKNFPVHKDRLLRQRAVCRDFMPIMLSKRL